MYPILLSPKVMVKLIFSLFRIPNLTELTKQKQKNRNKLKFFSYKKLNGFDIGF